MCSRSACSGGSGAFPPRATRLRAGVAGRQTGAAARSRPPLSEPLVVGLVRGLAADVVGDALLERLQALEQLLRWHGLLRLAAEQPRCGIDGRLPRDLLDRLGGAAAVRFLERLDAVEVDVRESAALLLVEGDTRRSPLGSDRVARDLLSEGRVLAALVVAEDEPRVAGLRLERLHLGDGDDRIGHGGCLPRSRSR